MKKLLLLFFISVFSLNIFANYSTPGTGRSWTLDSLVFYSSGNVTFSGGIYFVNDTITVSVSDTLSVLSDATIKLAGLVLINIDGTLIVNPPQLVTITAQDTSQKFTGMRFSDLSDASVLRKCTFEYGNAIKLVNSEMIIDSCIIRYNTLASNFSSGAISLTGSNAVISNCSIYRNRRSAIISAANIASSPVITGNRIYENNVFNENYPQINLGASETQQLIIKNNVITGLYDMAGAISFFPIGSIPNCLIEGNIIKKNRYGIAFLGNNINAYLVNNIIDSNNINPNAYTGGSGINFNGNSTQTVITSRNTIRWNLWGITIQGTAKPDLGNIINSDTSDDGYNQIYFNSHNDTTIDLYNNTPDSIKAQNNYWGTTNLDTIAKHIFHRPNNPMLGFVQYIPIWIPIGIQNISSEVPAAFHLYNVYPNPFNPNTIIRYQVSRLSDVKLSVFDITGREVAALVNQKQMPGTYQVNFSGNGFASGVYFYKLTAGNYSETKKMILIK